MKKFYQLALAIILMSASGLFMMDYLKGSDEKKVLLLRQLVNSNNTIEALLDSTYEEKSINVAGVSTKLYESEYSFIIKGKVYKGKASLIGTPIGQKVKVAYLPSNPEINSSDPKKELHSELEKDSSYTSLYLSLILFGLSLVFLWRFNRVRKSGSNNFKEWI